MGLYLCVFASPDTDDELDGVEVGSYDDFDRFRSTVARQLENGRWASRFQVLMSHPDSDGEWSAEDAATLSRELATIEAELAVLPAIELPDGWQSGVATSIGLVPASAAQCFIDVDGEPLLRQLRDLADLAAGQGLPISFQ